MLRGTIPQTNTAKPSTAHVSTNAASPFTRYGNRCPSGVTLPYPIRPGTTSMRISCSPYHAAKIVQPAADGRGSMATRSARGRRWITSSVSGPDSAHR